MGKKAASQFGGADELFFAGHIERSGAGDPKTGGKRDHLFMLDKVMFLDLLPETAGQDLGPRQIRVGQDQGKLLHTMKLEGAFWTW